MLGLLGEPEALAAAGDRRAGRRARARCATRRSRPLPPAADAVPELIPYDARRQKALELTFREALRLGHNYIGTEHILLALLELEDGAGVLAGLGIDKEKAEAHVLEVLAAEMTGSPE